MAPTPRPAPSLAGLTEAITAAVAAHGAEPARAGLTGLCTAALFLGAGDEGAALVREIGAPDRPTARLTSQLWAAHTRAFPYLAGHLDPVTGWLDHPAEHDEAALADVLTVCATTDLHAVAESPQVRGDLLGHALAALTAPGDKARRGAFYTPATLASLTAALAGVEHAPPGSSVHEPAVGGGAMAVAAVRACRAAGTDPTMLRWVLRDIDPRAVAVAGIAMSIHGIPWVTLTVGDALSPAGAA